MREDSSPPQGKDPLAGGLQELRLPQLPSGRRRSQAGALEVGYVPRFRARHKRATTIAIVPLANLRKSVTLPSQDLGGGASLEARAARRRSRNQLASTTGRGGQISAASSPRKSLPPAALTKGSEPGCGGWSTCLPVVRGAATIIVHDHPFFRGASDEFKAKIVHHIQRRYFGDRKADAFSHVVTGLDRQGVFSASYVFQQDPAKVRTLIEQGEAPSSDYDGVLLTDHRFDAEFEVLLDGHKISTKRTSVALGVEATMGLTKAPVFSLRLQQEPSVALFVVPREALMSVLASEEMFAADAALLRRRAHRATSEMLHQWLCLNASNVNVRLLANSSAAFKQRLIQSVEVRLCSLGSVIAKEGESTKSCFCLFTGEAEVTVGGQSVCELRQADHSAGWTAWWGFLEASGTCSQRPATLTANTDCIIWELSARDLKELKADFAKDCHLFDEVAARHLRMLSPLSKNIWQASFLNGCDPKFILALSYAAKQFIAMPQQSIVRERERGTDMFFLAQGLCTVQRGEKPMATLSSGSYFGELAMLGVSTTRTATVVCDTVCDLRVLDRRVLMQTLRRYPDENARLKCIVEAHSLSRKVAIDQLKTMDILSGCSDEFLSRLTDQMYAQAFFVGQSLLKQDVESEHMYVVVNGAVEVTLAGVPLSEVRGPVVVGELALLRPGARALATVRCTSFCECLVVHTPLLGNTLLHEFPQDALLLEELTKGHVEDLRDALQQKFHAAVTPGLVMGRSSMAATALEVVRRASARPTGQQPKAQGGTSTFFTKSDPAFLEQLSLQLEKRIFLDGQVMLQEGVPGELALFIQDGEGIVEVGGMQVAKVQQGDFVGEVVLLGFSPHYTATVKADGLVTAFAIEKQRMREVIVHFPAEKRRMEEIMQKRLNATRRLMKIRAISRFLRGYNSGAESRQQAPGPLNLTLKAEPEEGQETPRSRSPGGSGSEKSWSGGFAAAARKANNAGATAATGKASRRPSVAMSSLGSGNLGQASRRASLAMFGGAAAAAVVATSGGHIDGNIDLGSHSRIEEESTPKRQQMSGRASSKRWIRRRKEMLRKASWQRDFRLLKSGIMIEMLPPEQSFKGADDEALSGSSDAQPSTRRYTKAAAFYGKPVWHEVGKAGLKAGGDSAPRLDGPDAPEGGSG